MVRQRQLTDPEIVATWKEIFEALRVQPIHVLEVTSYQNEDFGANDKRDNIVDPRGLRQPALGACLLQECPHATRGIRPSRIQSKAAVGTLQLVATLALTALALYLLFTGRISAGVLRFLFFTSIIFGLAVWETRDKWEHRRYWLMLVACLAIHFILIVVIRTYLAEFPMVIWGVLGTIEAAGVFWILLSVGG